MMTGANKSVRLDVKGLIIAHGEREGGYLSAPGADSASNRLADTPRIQFTLASMAAAGVEKILISVSPEDLIGLKDAVRRSAYLSADVSYLLVNAETSLCTAIGEANEFMARAKVLVMAGGVFFVAIPSKAKLIQAVNVAQGATWFTARRGNEVKAAKGTGVFLLDKASQSALRQGRCQPGECRDSSGLREYCIRELKYSETDFGDGVILADFVRDSLSEDTIVSAARNLDLLVQQD